MDQILVKYPLHTYQPTNQRPQYLEQLITTNKTQQIRKRYPSVSLTQQQQLQEGQNRHSNHLFYNRMKDLVNEIEVVESSLGHASQNGRTSQIEYVSEMGQQQMHPMILSQINNPRPGINKLTYLRLRNSVSEMRQVHFQLEQYLEEEKRLMQDFQEQLCLQVDVLFKQQKQKAKQSNNQMQVQMLKNQNNILRQRLQRKELEFQRMNRQLQSLRNNAQQRRKILKSSLTQNCSQDCIRCKDLQVKHHLAQSQLQKNQGLIEERIAEIEQLQEYIFDLQQRIAGVDLQVQRKLKQQLIVFGELKQSPNSKANRQLKLELQELKYRFQQMEQAAANHSSQIQQLKLKELQVKHKDEQLKKMQISIRQAQKQYEQLRQTSYERQHQILQAEQNLSKKINEIRIKESQLSQWQLQLTRRAKDSSCQEAPAQQSSELKISREISLKSFGKAPQDILVQNQYAPRVSERVRTCQNETQGSSAYTKNISFKQISVDKSQIERKYFPENDYKRQQLNTFNKKTNAILSNYRQQRKPSPYRKLPQKSRITQNGLNSSHYRESSKKSRYSATKSVKNISPYSSTITDKIRGEGVPLSGLGSKLQKLREQIKKQIESIK